MPTAKKTLSSAMLCAGSTRLPDKNHYQVDAVPDATPNNKMLSNIQERMVWHLSQCDPDYGRRVGDGLGIDPASVPPVPVGANA